MLASTLGVLMVFRYALFPVTAVMGTFDLPIRRLSGAGDEEDENGDNAKKMCKKPHPSIPCLQLIV